MPQLGSLRRSAEIRKAGILRPGRAFSGCRMLKGERWCYYGRNCKVYAAQRDMDQRTSAPHGKGWVKARALLYPGGLVGLGGWGWGLLINDPYGRLCCGRGGGPYPGLS